MVQHSQAFSFFLAINKARYSEEKGQEFNIVVRQITADGTIWKEDAEPPIKWRRSIGSFQLTIPVEKKEILLEPEERLLSNLRWIEMAIPSENRWFSVFGRYVERIADRVDAFGGDSSKVKASSSGDWRNEYRNCTILALVTAVLIAILVATLGTIIGDLQAIIDLPVFAFLIIVGYYWFRRCRPQACRLLKTLVVGVSLGAIILALIALLGMFTLQLLMVLVLSVIVVVVATIGAWMKRCF